MTEFENWFEKHYGELFEKTTLRLEFKEIAFNAWNAALESKWQPIETAPLDKAILAGCWKNTKSNKYVGLFLKQKPENIKGLVGLFPNQKEITESYAALNAVRAINELHKLKSVIVIGDGSKPRTAALIALNTHLNACSVDPKMRPKQLNLKKQIKMYRSKIEDIGISDADIIVHVHSHATLQASVDRCPNAKFIISIPCCVPDNTPKGFSRIESFDDYECMSEKRTVNIYRRN